MFLVHRQGKDVAMMWTVANPGQVARYEILRSYDGEFFDIIKEMPGGNGSRCRHTDIDVYAGYTLATKSGPLCMMNQWRNPRLKRSGSLADDKR